MTPYCSIAFATYNKAKLLKNCLESIFDQKPPFEFEVIVTNDGSNDNTEEVCKSFPVIYNYLDRPYLCGAAAARNMSYKKARGKIMVLQSDDIIHTANSIEVLATKLQPNTFLLADVDNILTAFSYPPAIRDHGVIANDRGLFDHIIPIGSYMNERRMREAPLFFLGSILRKYLYAIGGDDEDFIHPNYEDNWFFERLLHGLKLKPIFTNETKGYHQDHAAMENRNMHLHEMQALFFRKMNEGNNGINKWCSPTGPWQYVD